MWNKITFKTALLSTPLHIWVISQIIKIAGGVQLICEAVKAHWGSLSKKEDSTALVYSLSCLMPQLLGLLPARYLNFPLQTGGKHVTVSVWLSWGATFLILPDIVLFSTSVHVHFPPTYSIIFTKYNHTPNHILWYRMCVFCHNCFLYTLKSPVIFFQCQAEIAHFQKRRWINNIFGWMSIPFLLLNPLERVLMIVRLLCKSSIFDWKNIPFRVGISSLLSSFENNFTGNLSY